jgi:hypothetical protein
VGEIGVKVRCAICGIEHDVEWKMKKINGRGDLGPRIPDVWICFKHWGMIHSAD